MKLIVRYIYQGQLVRALSTVWFILCTAVFTNGASAQEQDWIQSWLFNGRTEANIRLSLQNQAEQKLSQLKEHCSLTDEQATKLKLAAAGDVNRFFHEVAQARKATKGLDQQNQNAVQEAWAVVSPLTTRLNAGLFDEKSLFTKVMTSTLDDAQVDEYKRLIAEQLERRHHAMVLTTVSTIEDSLPLVADQRKKLIELLDAQKLKAAPPQQGLETYVGYAKLAKVPEGELEKLFDKEQMKALKTLRDRYAPIIQMFDR
jgi:hypothetical protein